MIELCKYLSDLPKNQITDKMLRKCLEEIIKNQQKGSGLVAIRGICELYKENKESGLFSSASSESLTSENNSDEE